MRAEKGLSQADVAKALGVSQAQYQKYETGKSEPNFRMIYRICALYEVFPGQLMMGRATTLPEVVEEMTPDERQKMIGDLEHLILMYRSEAAKPPGERPREPEQGN